MRELDSGRPAIVWADAFSASWSSLPRNGMWMMKPLLVLSQRGTGFMVLENCETPFFVESEELQMLRGVVKKDRFRISVLDGLDIQRKPEGIFAGIQTCCSLFLDKPPAGSTKNFGITGMDHFIKTLRDETTALGWGKKFAGNERFIQGAFGRFGQPGIWDWIEKWGTGPGADRETYANFLRSAQNEIGKDFSNVATLFDESFLLWRDVAEAAIPNTLPELALIKSKKCEISQLGWRDPLGTIELRASLISDIKEIYISLPDLTEISKSIRNNIASSMELVMAKERVAIEQLRQAIA